MPNREDHLLIGALVGLSLYAVLKLFEGHRRYRNTPEFYRDLNANATPLDRLSQQIKGAVANSDPDLTEFLGSGMVGALAATIPDKLEPATNPNHRELFHSYLFLVGTLATELHILKGEQAKYLLKLLSLAAAGGYSSHLLADSFTKKSLPLI